MNKYDSCQDELIMFSYLSGTVFIALACLYTGDLTEGARFVYDQVGVSALTAGACWLLFCYSPWFGDAATKGRSVEDTRIALYLHSCLSMSLSDFSIDSRTRMQVAVRLGRLGLTGTR